MKRCELPSKHPSLGVLCLFDGRYIFFGCFFTEGTSSLDATFLMNIVNHCSTSFFIRGLATLGMSTHRLPAVLACVHNRTDSRTLDWGAPVVKFSPSPLAVA